MTQLIALAKNRVERELFDEFLESLKKSHLEPIEVTEVRRGYGVRLRGCFTRVSVHIEQLEDAELLEPMEWLIGRLISFRGKSYLLPAWEKIPFRKRKMLRSSIYSYLKSHPDDTLNVNADHPEQETRPDETLSTSEGDLADSVKEQLPSVSAQWFKTHAIWILNQCKEVSSQ